MKFNAKVSSVILAATACFFMLFSNTAFAGTERCEVEMILIGSTDSAGPVLLAKKIAGATCPGWGTRKSNNFMVTAKNQDACLAIMLTGESLNKTVFLHSIDDTFGNFSTMHQVYLGNDK